MGRNEQATKGRRVPLVCVVLFLLLLYQSDHVFSDIAANIGWLYLSRPATWAVARQAEGEKALSLFEEAMGADSSNTNAFLGAGVAGVVLRDDAYAVAAWKEGGVDPETLIKLGVKAVRQDDALVYFRGAASIYEDHPSEGKYLAGQVCQKTLAGPDALSLSNQRFCQEYFRSNEGNLVLNGQFNEGTTWGWNGQFYFADPASSTYSLDWVVGMPLPSLSITGFTEAHHRGFYQRVALEPGTEVRFGAYFRYEGEADLDARLLYVEWRQKEEICGNHTGALVDVREDWTYLERSFKLPNGAEPWAQFYPASIRGQGHIWIDDVRLERLAE